MTNNTTIDFGKVMQLSDEICEKYPLSSDDDNIISLWVSVIQREHQNKHIIGYYK